MGLRWGLRVFCADERCSSRSSAFVTLEDSSCEPPPKSTPLPSVARTSLARIACACYGWRVSIRAGSVRWPGHHGCTGSPPAVQGNYKACERYDLLQGTCTRMRWLARGSVVHAWSTPSPYWSPRQQPGRSLRASALHLLCKRIKREVFPV